MSVTSLFIIDPVRLPSFEAIQREAASAGETIDLHRAVDLRSHTGFLPVRVEGRDTGFEYYFMPVPVGDLPEEAGAFGSHCIVTSTGSSMEEGRAALLFLKVAARLTAGAYVYPDDEIVVPPEEVAAYLDGEIEEYGRYIEAEA